MVFLGWTINNEFFFRKCFLDHFFGSVIDPPDGYICVERNSSIVHLALGHMWAGQHSVTYIGCKDL